MSDVSHATQHNAQDEDDDDGTGRKKIVKGMSEKKLQKWIETNEKKGAAPSAYTSL
jgi:hypothetical protein